MLKPDKKELGKWIISKSIMVFRFKTGLIKKGIVNGCYGHCLHVNFCEDGEKIAMFDRLDSITEVKELLLGPLDHVTGSLKIKNISRSSLKN